MIKMPDTKGNFFSVKHSTTIRGAKHTPSVCYKLTSDLQSTVEEMAKGDNPLAHIYPEEVRFVTGVPYPVKKPVAAPSSSVPASKGKPASPAPAQVAAVAGKSGSKRSAKGAYAQQTRRAEFA
jgi:hypothetical protein